MFRRSALHHGYDARVVQMGNYTTSKGVNNFVSIRVAATLEFLETLCDHDVVMVLDAYDIFFLQAASTALSRFRAAGAAVLWSVERMYSQQDPPDIHFYDEAKRTLDASGRGSANSPYLYINSGGFMGYASSLRTLVREALTIRPGAAGWRNKTCGEARGRQCADQWIFGKLLAGSGGDGLRRFNVSLDYKRTVFYVATGFDWSYAAASRRILETSPAVFHMPFIQAPRVNATLHALYAGHFLRDPPIDANYTMCMQRSNWCRDASWGARDMMEQLDRFAAGHATAVRRQAADVYLQHRTPKSTSAGAPKSAALSLNRSAALPSRDGTQSPPEARYLLQAACHNMSWKPSQRDHCSVARDALDLKFWDALAELKASRNGLFNFVGSTRQHHHNREPFLAAIDRFLWQPRPHCFSPPSGVRCTWVAC